MTYTALSEATVAGFLGAIPAVAAVIGGPPSEWSVREVGDGNLNLVFIVTGASGGVAAKQALPYVRLVGESWPLPLSRAYYERLALADEARLAPERVPALIHHDDAMALTVMELLTPHRVLRGALCEGQRFPRLATHIAQFLARTLFLTSDLAVPAAERKAHIAAYLGNTAMCRITEDLIFDEPYFAAPLNQHNPALDPLVATLRADVDLRLAAQEMKARFLAAPEALLHGDMHSGSIMVTADDTRVIDCEFAFFGPIGFDVGMFIANLLMAQAAQPGQRPDAAEDPWLLDQATAVWDGFAAGFAQLWRDLDPEAETGALYALAKHDPALREAAIARRFDGIWQDALGFAGCEIIRRILGLAHIADFECIADEAARAGCEAHALLLARSLLVERSAYPDMASVIAAFHRLRP